IMPQGKFQSKQKYISDTNVLETYFETDEGSIRLLDCFSVLPEDKRLDTLYPEHEILRVVEGVSGIVPMKLNYEPRPFYGKEVPRLEDRKKFGVHFCWKDNIYTLLSTLDPEKSKLNDNSSNVYAEFSVHPGERI